MAQDRFVYFEETNFPTQEKLVEFLVKFFERAAKVQWDEALSRFFVTLIGQWSHYTDQKLAPDDTQRLIEVIPTEQNADLEGSIDVLTRDQDPFTRSLASGLVLHLCLAFHGKADREDFQLPPFVD